MYELKRLFKRHIEENFLKYLIVLFFIAAGILIGFIFSENINPDISGGLNREIDDFIGRFSEGSFNRPEILLTSFFKTLRITVMVFLGGLSVWLLPVAFVSLFSYGFSLGFTIGYLSSNFGRIGLWIALVSDFFVFLINIPVYVILAVVAFNNTGYRKRSCGTEKNLGLYTAIFAVLFVISLISILADGFFVPSLITLICR